MTANEQILTEEWCSRLDLSHAADDGNFFELGGDSLMAIELVTVFEERSGTTFPIEVLFQDGRLGAVRAALGSS